MKKTVGKCPYCEKDLTAKDLKEGLTEFGTWTNTKVFRCIHCDKIISITHSKYS